MHGRRGEGLGRQHSQTDQNSAESPQVPSKGGKVTAGWAIPGCCSLSLDDSRKRLQLIRNGQPGVMHQPI